MRAATTTSPSRADEPRAEPVAEPPHRHLDAGVRDEERGREEADDAEPDAVGVAVRSATAPTFARLNPGVNASASPPIRRAVATAPARHYRAALLRLRYARVFLRLPQSCIEHQVAERFGELS